VKNFGLPDETRISSVDLRTANLERALEFYQRVLGFKTMEQKGATVSLSATGQAPALIILSENREAAPHPRRATGLYHFAIRYPERSDLAHALRRLARNDHLIQGASDHIVSEAIYLSDPDDNGIELYADRPRAQWVWRNGQVAMSTQPLDTVGLLGLVETEPERTDAPPGTDIGHIHLHVADLDPAERFYHEFLGLAVTQRSYPGALFFGAGGYHHHIGVNTWAGKSRAQEDTVGLVSYRLTVPVKEILYCLRHRAPLAGYEIRSQASDTCEELLQIRDPNGNWLEVCQSGGS
jgi:catechol 2,3-dioxygenase